MTKERYSIVRADKFCPRDLERNYKLKCIGSLHCDKCDLKKKYGDTKEQLIRKVAQIRFKQETQYGSKDMLKATYNICYKQAKEIVEFLGVK